MNGKLLGIIEAKKVGVGPQNVLEQAKRYSRGVTNGVGNWNGFRVPFLFSTNGEVIHFIDIRDTKNTSRKISNFFTVDALEELFSINFLIEVPMVKEQHEIYRIRPYQRNAIREIEKAIANGKRSMLVAMATGTGKTFLTVAQIYRLLKSKTAKRVLFLVDRKALAAQAVREFTSFTTPTGNKFNQEYDVFSQRFQKEDFGDDVPFDPSVLPHSYLTSPNESQTFVYVSTIQRMTINLFGWENAFHQERNDPDDESDAEKTDIPIHAFDLIIADECHRGYTAKETAIWRDVLEYFDAIKIGLTATPAPHSLSLFNEVIFRYTTDEAIEDGYLVDYEAIKIHSNVRINGAFLKEGEHIVRVDTTTGKETYDELEDEREFSSEDIERHITAPDSNKKIIHEIAKYAYEHEKETGHFPKILIFAVNDLPHTSHADQLVTICREEFQQGDSFVQKITGSASVDRPLQKIREFRNRPTPKVVVTVDMLSTGVDIPSLEFIVFLRPVKSRILWVQMLGRGTRLCSEINKTHFKIFDCFGGTLIEYFKNTTDFKIEPPEKEAIPLAQVIENIYQNIDRKYFTSILVKRLRRIEKEMSGNARMQFSAYVPEGDIGKFAEQVKDKIANDFTETMKLLRDKKFQDLLLNYERAKRTFIKALEVVDTVTSEMLVAEQKPEDYLVSFSKFVRENPEQIEAIKILLERPKEWKTDALNDLRLQLQKKNFGEKELQQAHKLVYNKALADIISMVKHAAKNEEPLLSAEERVDKALQRITKGKTFSEEQQHWLGYIRNHLVANLTLDIEDFTIVPVFVHRGGIKIAQRVFNNELEIFLSEINYAMAA
ncbi:MAG: DEAD/DEAH box helicase [Ignavibacteria bacterium]|nr:DEAD/DEAH box helicase [Ignavibacteria bacterium]